MNAITYDLISNLKWSLVLTDNKLKGMVVVVVQ
jgi:hypothetical protein